MKENRVSFTFFGPVDGLQVINVGFHSPTDTSIPVFSSDFELIDSATAFIVSRVALSAFPKPATWIGIYKQTYERDLNRPGHSFGVGLWLLNESPVDLAFVVQALRILLGAMDKRCVSDGKFCDRDTFRSFATADFEPRVDTFCEELFPSWERLDARVGLRPTAGSTAFAGLNSFSNDSEIVRFIEEALYSQSATAYRQMIIADPKSGKIGHGVRPFQLINRMEAESFLVTLDKLDRYQEELNSVQQKFNGLSSQSAAERAAKDGLVKEVAQLKSQLRDANLRADSAQKKLNNSRVHTRFEMPVQSPTFSHGEFQALGDPHARELLQRIYERVVQPTKTTESARKSEAETQVVHHGLVREVSVRVGMVMLASLIFSLVFISAPIIYFLNNGLERQNLEMQSIRIDLANINSLVLGPEKSSKEQSVSLPEYKATQK